MDKKPKQAYKKTITSKPLRKMTKTKTPMPGTTRPGGRQRQRGS